VDSNPCVVAFKQEVQKVKNLLPVVLALRNPNLKKRHWEQIQQIFVQNKLDHALDKRMDEQLEPLSEISNRATQEAELEQLFAKIKELWLYQKELPFLPYKDSKEVYILNDLAEDVIPSLEDSLVQISTILSSRYLYPTLKEEVERWQTDLNILFDCLEEWQFLQKNWMYLESIFHAVDIKKQLPTENAKFAEIDTHWKMIMRECSEGNNLANAARLELFRKWNTTLDTIQKSLEDYLQSKRLSFPRFFFLSNDELLEILAQARKIEAVRPHLRKCFDGLYTLKFANVDRNSAEILGMESEEKEEVYFYRTLKARSGNVERWLNEVEETMTKSIWTLVRRGLRDYFANIIGNGRSYYTRARFVLEKHMQVVMTVDAILWCKITEECFSNTARTNASSITLLSKWFQIQMQQLKELTDLLKTFPNLTRLQRLSIVALITQDVHYRDITENLAQEKITSAKSFKWQQQLRFYYDNFVETILVRQVDAVVKYGYEYTGNTTRLVITPLTDRCFLTITGALHLKLGANPSGPAGTGKTESTKDLAKQLARHCVVFNCSEQIDYKMMAKLYSGVVSCGSWTCLDEFNRISIEVLSVIAQQLTAIRQALLQCLSEFFFEGNVLLKLKPTCLVCITMNPGYAGRTELPDNLKILFRPISMMVPDFTLIAEVMLFAEGFATARKLSKKFTYLFKLCSEQLSQQDHYDFGMRAVKSVLLMAGNLLKKHMSELEHRLLLAAMRDANVPKFVADDVPLFSDIVQDLFPSNAQKGDGGSLAEGGDNLFSSSPGLTPVPAQISKIVQLFETLQLRIGVSLVGQTLSGKTVCYETLAKSLTLLRDQFLKYVQKEIKTHVLNPKCISMGELYGEFSELTQEWQDGLGSSLIRMTTIGGAG
ncbi:unnamed protein product, partial [Amoebophrya sp. A120]